jgi:hypothetical protein
VLAVARQLPPGLFEGDVLADAREHVEQRPVAAPDQARLVGGQ